VLGGVKRVNHGEFFWIEPKGNIIVRMFLRFDLCRQPQSLKSRAVVMFEVLLLYKGEYDIGDLSCARFPPVLPPNQAFVTLPLSGFLETLQKRNIRGGNL